MVRTDHLARDLVWPALFAVAVCGATVTVWLSLGTETAVTDPGETTSVDAPTGPPAAGVVERALESAVLVSALGCGAESQGVGVAIDGGVVTNAHVVAGATDIRLTTASGNSHEALVVAFDPLLDLALLQADSLGVPALELASPSGGAEAVVLSRVDTGGKAELVPVEVNIERTINIFIADIYGDGRHERSGMELAADLGPGDSGSGIVDSAGRVVGVVFSTSRLTSGVAYAVSAAELGALVEGRSANPVGGGDCR